MLSWAFYFFTATAAAVVAAAAAFIIVFEQIRPCVYALWLLNDEFAPFSFYCISPLCTRKQLPLWRRIGVSACFNVESRIPLLLNLSPSDYLLLSSVWTSTTRYYSPFVSPWRALSTSSWWISQPDRCITSICNKNLLIISEEIGFIYKSEIHNYGFIRVNMKID